MAEALIDVLDGLFAKHNFKRSAKNFGAIIDRNGLYYHLPNGWRSSGKTVGGWYARFWFTEELDSFWAEVSTCSWNNPDTGTIRPLKSVNVLEVKRAHIFSPNFKLDVFIDSLLKDIPKRNRKNWRVHLDLPQR